MSASQGLLSENARVLNAIGSATCNICGRSGDFSGPADHLEGLTLPAGYELREGLVCGGCGSITRDRAIIQVLADLLGEQEPLSDWGPRRQTRVLETSGFRGHPPRLERVLDYFNTRYLPPSELPETIDGRTTADLEDLPYPSGFFDLLITSEVLEHVADLGAALSEMHRVLGEEGRAVITVPYFHDWAKTSTRVHRWRDRDVLLQPPEYHADATLVYRLFGRDFLATLAVAGFSVAYVAIADPRRAIATTEVIIASKAPFLDLTPFLADARLQ